MKCAHEHRVSKVDNINDQVSTKQCPMTPDLGAKERFSCALQGKAVVALRPGIDWIISPRRLPAGILGAMPGGKHSRNFIVKRSNKMVHNVIFLSDLPMRMAFVMLRHFSSYQAKLE